MYCIDLKKSVKESAKYLIGYLLCIYHEVDNKCGGLVKKLSAKEADMYLIGYPSWFLNEVDKKCGGLVKNISVKGASIYHIVIFHYFS